MSIVIIIIGSLIILRRTAEVFQSDNVNKTFIYMAIVYLSGVLTGLMGG